MHCYELQYLQLTDYQTILNQMNAYQTKFRRIHNPKVGSSILLPATKKIPLKGGIFLFEKYTIYFIIRDKYLNLALVKV
jgi:hypothetical protein